MRDAWWAFEGVGARGGGCAEALSGHGDKGGLQAQGVRMGWDGALP